MNEVVILIPIVNMPHNRTEDQLVLFMAAQLQKLIDLGALKGAVDDILKDYYVDDMTNYINITIPQSALGLTNELEAVGAATCPTYKVPTNMLQYIDAVDGELRSFSAGTINERLRIAMRNPKLRFRYTIMDYKKFYKQKESMLKKKPEMAKQLKNMFLTDVMGMFTEVLPQIEEGKQLATLVGTSQVTPKLNKVARELSMAYRKALRMEKNSGQINKSAYKKLKESYTNFMTELMEQVFPGMEEQKEESRKYSYCEDGRIDLFADPTPEQLEKDAEEEVINEETRALNEDLMHFEEESQKEYSELGENTYIVVKYIHKDKDVDSYYYDLISELHPLFEKLDGVKINQSIKSDDWIVTKLSDSVELKDALKLLKKQGVKSFSDDMTEVTFRTTNPERLTEIVNAIGECGNGGHSFEIVIDPEAPEDERMTFGWDGDGNDRIEVTDKSFSSEKSTKWVVYLEGTPDNQKPSISSISTEESNEDLKNRWLDYNNESRKVKRSKVKVFESEKDAKNYFNSLKSSHSFSEPREKVSAEMLEKAKTDGVVQKKPNGSWGIISIDAGEWWTPDYESEEKAKNALEAYHANKFGE